MGRPRAAGTARALARTALGSVKGRRKTVVADATVETKGAVAPEPMEQLRLTTPLAASEAPNEAAPPAPRRPRAVVVAVLATEILGPLNPPLDAAHLAAATVAEARPAAARLLAPGPVRVERQTVVGPLVPA